MGLVKTVFSPFTNTTPLVSIILVIILVAIFRFSGGGFTVADKNILPVKKSAVKEKVANNIDEQKELPKEGTIKIDANEFDRLIKLRPVKKKEDSKKGDNNSNSFDTIEAELGLK